MTDEELTEELRDEPEELGPNQYRYCNTCKKIRKKDSVICEVCGDETEIKERKSRSSKKKSSGRGRGSPTTKTTKPKVPVSVPPHDSEVLAQLLKAYRVPSDVSEAVIDLFNTNPTYKRDYNGMMRLLTAQGIRHDLSAEITRGYFETIGGVPGINPPMQQGISQVPGMSLQPVQPNYYTNASIPQNPQVVYYQVPMPQPPQPQVKEVVLVPKYDEEGRPTGEVEKVERPVVVIPQPQPVPQPPPLPEPSGKQPLSELIEGLKEIDELRKNKSDEDTKVVDTSDSLTRTVDTLVEQQSQLIQSQIQNSQILQGLYYQLQELQNKSAQPQVSVEEAVDKYLERLDRMAERLGWQRGPQTVTGRTSLDILDGLRQDVGTNLRILVENLSPGKSIKSPSSSTYATTRTPTQRKEKADRIMQRLSRGEDVVKAENALIESVHKWINKPKSGGS